MAYYPNTKNGYNMYDMLSMMQKGIRRNDFRNAGFAANELKSIFRKVMWNRLLVISAEDCFGVLTKEIVRLKEEDDVNKNSSNVSNAVALMCIAKKNRDACYFACNFVLASRKPREIEVTQLQIDGLRNRIDKMNKDKDCKYEEEYDQVSLFDNASGLFSFDDGSNKFEDGVKLQTAITHLDMDMIGYQMDQLRKAHRDFLWDVFIDYASNIKRINIINEIEALRKADDIVNSKKKDKDEIFISKAAILLCQSNDDNYENIESGPMINLDSDIDWLHIKAKSIETCKLENEEIPDWVYDCHTLKGKKMGKTDWDMTTTEQNALTPLRKCYFDDASWFYTYEQDYENGSLSDSMFEMIKKYGETHEANPVKYHPYY